MDLLVYTIVNIFALKTLTRFLSKHCSILFFFKREKDLSEETWDKACCEHPNRLGQYKSLCSVLLCSIVCICSQCTVNIKLFLESSILIIKDAVTLVIDYLPPERDCTFPILLTGHLSNTTEKYESFTENLAKNLKLDGHIYLLHMMALVSYNSHNPKIKLFWLLLWNFNG